MLTQNHASMIINLIKKDFSFVIILLLVFSTSSLMFIVYVQTTHPLKDTILFMLPLWYFTAVIVKICYIEDKYSTSTFLKSLPVSKKLLVLEKFILSQILLLIGIVETVIMYLFFPTAIFPLNLSQILLEIAYVELYFGSYLYVFFRFTYFTAKLPQNLIIGTWFCLYMNRITFDSLTIPLYYAILIFIASLGSVYLFMKLSIKHMR